MTQKLLTALGGCKDAGTSPANARTVGFSLLLSVSLAHHCILVGEDWAGIGFTREELTDELTTAISAYLAARQPSRASRSATALVFRVRRAVERPLRAIS